MKRFQEIISEDDFNKALKTCDVDNNLAFVYCMAEWCPECRMLIPKLNQLEEKYNEGVKFYELNVDGDGLRILVQKLGIHRAPTIILFKGRKEVARQVSAKPPEELLKSHLERLTS